MKAVTIESAEFGQVRSRKDHSVSCTFVTPELRPSEAGALIALHGLAVRIAIVPHDVEPEETVSVNTELGAKTPSQRLRSVLYVAFTHQHKQGQVFQAYYEEAMEELINTIKDKLP